MNLVLDFDVVNAIKDVNEKYSVMKIIRNKKGIWIKTMPFIFAVDYLIGGKRVFLVIPIHLFWYFLLDFTLEFTTNYKFGDPYESISQIRLILLSSSLSDINVNTSYELIKEAECYKKVYNLRFNDKKIPQLVESKYILLPTYGFDGEIIEESLVQEHVVGSKTYVLSKGSPSKVLKPAFSMQ
jgi:hypothetical protein